MLLKITLVLALAAKGSSDCPRWRNTSVCLLKPEMKVGMPAVGWFYEVSAGKCSPTVYRGPGSPDENRFSSQSECNEVCRRDVPGFCFENPPNNPGKGARSQKWTYRSSNGQCVQIQWNGAIQSCKNIFDSSQECERMCKIPDYGVCAKGIKSGCTPTDAKWYWFNYKTLKCQEMNKTECPNGEGNAFRTFYECNRRCGRFVQDKCGMPIQNISSCIYLAYQYGYNTLTKRCEQFKGCDDGGNSFDTHKQCWETCAKNPTSPCAQKPDVSQWKGAFTRYYYDIDKNVCVRTSQFSKRTVNGKTNIFYTFKECQRLCIGKSISFALATGFRS
ncbi:papilin-like [Ixodes scapularis]|uniref:papilin-like n=1 Tax=Ixodes scapularis TaxID=6945 RepID=UPI001A9DB53A|nr:papilin-like [Ixodes scapularis]